jgi:hypothetical protein
MEACVYFKQIAILKDKKGYSLNPLFKLGEGPQEYAVNEQRNFFPVEAHL